MNRFLLSTIAVLAVNALSLDVSAAPQQAGDFPYQGLIRVPSATIHSGPARVHYGTSTLEQGTSVEVYRHDPGGWCAIRPPKDSFSMVPATTLTMVREGVAEVNVNHTRAWVGTRLGPVKKPLWQVKLKKGELVNVIGELSYPNPEGYSNVWLQIEPPPGEFRWVHKTDLEPLFSDLPQPELANSFSPTDEQQLANATEPELKKSGILPPPEKDSLTAPNLTGLNSPSFRPQLGDRNLQSRLTSNQQTKVIAKEPPTLVAASGYAPTTEQPATIQLATHQEVVLPNNQDGINQGWRQSRKAITGAISGAVPGAISGIENKFPSDAQATFPISGASNFGASKTVQPWNPGNQYDLSPLKKNEPVPFSDPSSPTWSRYAEATQSSQTLAQQIDLAMLPNAGVSDSNAGVSDSNANVVGVSDFVAILDNQLTNEMVKSDPSAWNLDEIIFRAQERLLTTTSSNEKNEIERLILKVRNCQNLKMQFVGSSETSAARNSTFVGTNSNDTNPSEARYQGFDAVGKLFELTRNQGLKRSTYVLKDETGKITHHIEPIPGVNLDRYLERKIGVIGGKNYDQNLKLPHISVSRVFGL